MADDIDFKQAMRGVRPLRKDATHVTSPNRRPNKSLREQIQRRAHQSAAQFEPADSVRISLEHTGQSNPDGDDALYFLRSGVQKKVMRELKKGSRYKVENVVDLHGLTQTQAQQKIDSALQQLDPSRLSCMLIIHGKGLHSENGATLKRFTAAYLKTQPAVKAYCSAQQRDGGNGAVYVLLK